MLYIGLRNQHSLRAAQTSCLADIKETLDLLVYSANRLHQPMLVDRSGHRQILAKRNFGKSRQDGIKLCRRGAIALNAGIRLFKYQTRRQRHRCIQRIPAGEKAGKDQHPLGMQRPAELNLPFDVYNLAGSWANPAGNAGRPPKAVSAERDHAQSIDLADPRSARLDQRHIAQNHFDAALANTRCAPNLLGKRPLYIGTAYYLSLLLPGPIICLTY